MTLQMLEVNIRPPFRWATFRPTVTARFAGGGEQRASLLSRSLRRYTIPVLQDPDERADLIAFFEARGWSLESFLWKDPLDYRRFGISPTQIGGKVFEIPTTGTYGGDYPIDDANLVVYDAGSPVAGVTVDVDARTVTLPSPPGGAVTMDYHYARRVRLVPGSFAWGILSDHVEGDFELVEVAIE